jgi:hypothetical protein
MNIDSTILRSIGLGSNALTTHWAIATCRRAFNDPIRWEASCQGGSPRHLTTHQRVGMAEPPRHRSRSDVLVRREEEDDERHAVARLLRILLMVSALRRTFNDAARVADLESVVTMRSRATAPSACATTTPR